MEQLNRQAMNGLVAANEQAGPGIFTNLLQQSLRRHGVTTRFFEHDLPAELAGGRRLPPGLTAALRPAT